MTSEIGGSLQLKYYVDLHDLSCCMAYGLSSFVFHLDDSNHGLRPMGYVSDGNYLLVADFLELDQQINTIDCRIII